MAHLEVNLAPAAEDMPQVALALMRAVIAAADQDRDEMTVLVIGGEPTAVIAPYGHERARARPPRSRLTRRRRLKHG